jgi:two-component system, sensor histidine kinase and response regulator
MFQLYYMNKEIHDIIGDCLEFSSNNKTMHETMSFILTNIMSITKCQYGFIGETKYNEDDSPYYRFHALRGFPENSMYTTDFVKNKYVDFMHPNTLHDTVFETSDIVVCHDILKHRKGKPFPEGHPIMNNFVLFPLRFKDKISGVIGLSGNEVTFNDIWLQSLSPMVHVTEHILFTSMEKKVIEDHTIRFLANISHELRTPLNGIVCTTNMLRDTVLDREQVELMEIITHCNSQLLDIINDILDYTKISLGNLTLNMTHISLKKCIDELIDALESNIQSKNLELNLHYGSGVDMVIADETRVTQIFLNLLNNALKFTKAGAIDIFVHDQSGDDDSCVLKFEIRDTGIGIPESKLKYIFDSFNQITNHLCNDCGAGLGLPITKYLVHMFNGTIWAESDVEKGTSMFFTLKFQRFTQINDMIQLKEYFSGKHILVVTNTDSDKEVLFNTLKEYGIKIVISSTTDMNMYHSEGIFTFESIVICMPLGATELDIQRIKDIKDKCPIVIIHPHVDIPKTYCYNKQLSRNLLTTILNDLYLLSNSKKQSVEDTIQPKSTINILVAEDTVENQNVMVNLLNKLDYYNVTVTGDGLEFYIELLKNDYDIAFVDLKMPVMDGISAVKKFKEKSKKNVVIVAVTASVSETIRDDCYNVGMNGYITKPIDWKELEIAMNMVFRRKKVLSILDGSP